MWDATAARVAGRSKFVWGWRSGCAPAPPRRRFRTRSERPPRRGFKSLIHVAQVVDTLAPRSRASLVFGRPMMTLCGPFTARPSRRRPYEHFVDSWVGSFWICRRSTCSEATTGLGVARHADFDARSPREGLFLALKPQEKRRFHFWGVFETRFDALLRRPSSG